MKHVQACSGLNSVYLSRVFTTLNAFMPNVFSHPNQIDESVSNSRVVGWYFPFFQIVKETSVNRPIPLDGDSTPIRNFGQNDTNHSRNGKSAVEA